MLAYHKFYPGLCKEAGLARYTYDKAKDWVKNNKLMTALGGVGLAGGTYLGNEVYKNSIPKVRVLPRMYVQEVIAPLYSSSF